MSFHISAQNIRVDDGHILRATLKNAAGEDVESELDLNRYLGNNDGHFEWEAADFSGSAQNVNFSVEGGDSVPILRAQLRDAAGEWHDRDINLAERIGNNDGAFEFRMSPPDTQAQRSVLTLSVE
ncbi:Cyanovirin-N [Lasiosphaeris hirsuta]|uniref:Cyanovirin-N n=1 Tax=Lasiosphaeris hirsuta TaxID=260670 RepID=A0AA40DK58_9PEZI|nr:Cyanovirin-N [Lasiosphaeris hirsuta]